MWLEDYQYLSSRKMLCDAEYSQQPREESVTAQMIIANNLLSAYCRMTSRYVKPKQPLII